MSILTEASRGTSIPVDKVFVIYGAPGSGKTTLASTFPKTKDKPLLYIDVLEGGAASISLKDRENIVRASIASFKDVKEVFGDVLRGFTLDGDGNKINVTFSTIVIDSLTQLEYIIKEGLKQDNKKDVMNLNLWGQAKDSQEIIFNTMKLLNATTGSIVVGIAHEKRIEDENNPELNKIVPSLMNAASFSIAAKAAYVWYTKISTTKELDPTTNKIKVKDHFYTVIDTDSALLTKCRKPKEFKIPKEIENLTYNIFNKNVIEAMEKAENAE